MTTTVDHTVDLSNFSTSIIYMPNKVKYFDETDNQDKETRECEITWKHNTLDLPELKFYLREDHGSWNDKIANRQKEILTEWLVLLGYDKEHYSFDDKTKIFTINGSVTDADQIEKWLKPNGQQELAPITVEEI
jgi:hypothetical protein